MTDQENTAEAGRMGDRVRSDCWVHLELTGTGGLEVEQNSKVDVIYGKQNVELCRRVLDTLGIENARVRIEDQGAVPFVLAARLEAAVKRLRPEEEREYLLDMAGHSRYKTAKDRFRRSRLYLPGDNPKFMLNAAIHGPDAIILDLEDAVAPEMKHDSRFVVRNALRTVDFMGCERMVRINQGDMGMEDLDFIVPHNVHVILVPKAESGDRVRAVDQRVREILEERGMEDRVFLMPIIESALGCIKAYEIASATDSVCALAIGLEDYTADIGARRTREGTESFWARCQVVNAAKAARVQAIDSVYSDVDDMEGLRQSCLEAKSLGFDGKGCIHPRQIKVIHEAFAPSDKELEKAKRIVLAYERAQDQGSGVVSLGSKMIDPPVVKRALRTVELARRIKLLEEDWRNEE